MILGWLVAARVVQGISAGLLVSAGQTIPGQAVGPQRLGRVMSILGIAVSSGPAIGPTVGGLLLHALPWPWLFLTRLRAAGGRMRMGALAAVLFSPGSRLNYRITRLTRLGLVRREQHPVDRRGLYAVLTAEGTQFLERIQPGYADAVHRSMAGALTEEEFLELGRLSDEVFRALRPPEAD